MRQNEYKTGGLRETAEALLTKNKKSTLSLTFNRVGLVLFSALMWPSLSYSSKVYRISIQGNKIIEKGLIQSHIRLKEAHSYNSAVIQKDVRRLFALGFFDDIEVHRFYSKKGWKVLYRVKESVPVSVVEFEGNDSLKTEDLKELLLIEENSFLNFDRLKKTISAIKEKYREKGYYLAEVSYKTKKQPEDKNPRLIISIKENTKLLIREIHFIGNRNISSEKLKSILLTKEKDILSFLSSSGIFQPRHIERDLRFIEYYYRDKGYLNARAHPPEITITPDQKFLQIYFPVSEGARFKVGQVVFRGDEVVLADQVKDLFESQEDEYFSLSHLQKDIQTVSLLYKNKGYALAEVHPQFFPDPTEENKVHILFKVKKGSIYKLGRVHLLGNKNARDKVILRRLRLQEGQIYNESRKELSRQLIQQLGYFENVEIQPRPSQENEDELDLIVRVKERENTGEAHFAGGYRGETRLFIQGGLKKQNFLGLDQSIAGNVIFNKYQEFFNFNYQSPYFLDTNWNFAFDIFNMSHSVWNQSRSGTFPFFGSSQDYFSYFQLNTGFSISLGRHLTDFSTLFLKYSLQNQILRDRPIYFLRNLPVLSSVFSFLFGDKDTGQTSTVFSDIYNLDSASGLNSSLSLIWEYDGRDDRYYASKGIFSRLSANWSGLGGDFNYTKLQLNFRHYYSPFWKLVIKNRWLLGWVFSNDNRPPPFTELFLMGGSYDLRGFPINSQGPRKRSQKAFEYAESQEQFIEASQKLLQNIENQKEESQKAQVIRVFLQNNKDRSQAVQKIQEEISSKDQKIDSQTIKDLQEHLQEVVDSANLPEAQLLNNKELFAQRPYGGQQMLLYSLELEFPILERAELRGAFFVDIGEANDRLSFNLDEQLRMNAGAGIRWKSPFGPLSLDWAFPYRPRKEWGESDWEFQFNMGAEL